MKKRRLDLLLSAVGSNIKFSLCKNLCIVVVIGFVLYRKVVKSNISLKT